jgi:hypothetical protein
MKHSFLISIFVVGIILILLGSCSSDMPGTVQGIVQDYSPDKGSFIIKTVEDRTYEIYVNQDTQLDIKGTSLSSLNFEAGLSMRVDLEGKQAKLIEINLAKIYGIIMQVEYDDLTLQPYGSDQQIHLRASIFSKILKAGSPLPLNLLTMGRIAEVYFNPVSKTAFQITEMPPDFVVNQEEGSRTGGTIAEYTGGRLTINTSGGIPATLLVDATTRIQQGDGSIGSVDDLRPGVKVNIEFNPFDSTAIKIEIRSE